MEKKYTIYTEYNINIPKIVSEFFDYATIIDKDIIGIYKGIQEKITIIEIIIDSYYYSTITLLADTIKEMNKQESVLITIQDIEIIYE